MHQSKVLKTTVNCTKIMQKHKGNPLNTFATLQVWRRMQITFLYFLLSIIRHSCSDVLVELGITMPLPLRFYTLSVQYQPKRFANKKTAVILRSSEQVVRLLIHLGEGKILGCPVSRNSIILCLNEAKSQPGEWNKLRSELDSTYATKLFLVSDALCLSASEIHCPTFLSILQFSIRCKLLSSGEWIYFGDTVDSLVGSKALCLPPESKNFILSPFVQIALEAANLENTETDCAIFRVIMKLSTSVYKILPLLNAEEDRVAYCLPRCATQAIVENCTATAPKSKFLQTTSDYQKYWFLQHGYTLEDTPQGPMRQFVEVCLAGYIRLSYPIGTVWREKAFLMPQLSSIHEMPVALKALSSFSQIQLCLQSKFEIKQHNIILRSPELPIKVSKILTTKSVSPPPVWVSATHVQAERSTQKSSADYFISKTQTPMTPYDANSLTQAGANWVLSLSQYRWDTSILNNINSKKQAKDFDSDKSKFSATNEAQIISAATQNDPSHALVPKRLHIKNKYAKGAKK